MAERRIKSIGMSLSGGGYRASGFHLGALDMLGRLQLLNRVKGLSTVSGGTITGAYYALSQSRTPEKPASEVFSTLARWLVGNDVIGRVLRERPHAKRSAASRRRNLITGASEIYNQLLDGALFGEVFDRSGHLEDVIFNTTEFQTGLDFRLQKTGHPTLKIGNRKWHITEEAARQLRLGDIVAASSDFPGGFEPLEFPADFVFPGPTPKMPDIPPRMAVMDGGIYDNQGTEALLLARKEREEYDVVLISDTDQKPQDAYFSMPERTKGSRGISIRLLVALIALVGVLTVGSSVRSVLEWIRSGDAWWEIAIGVLPSVVALGFFAGLFAAWRMARGAIVKSFPNLADGLRQYLLSLRWQDLVDLVSLRARTLMVLTASIFLKRVRQLGYKVVDKDETLDGNVVKNLIYAMARRKAAEEHPPTQAQKELAERANQMPTTLWFDNEQQFRDVFACGQNTVVHVLLRHLDPKTEAGQAPADADTTEVVKRLHEMWKLLQENPYRFVPDVGSPKVGGQVAQLTPGVTASGVATAQPSRETA